MEVNSGKAEARSPPSPVGASEMMAVQEKVLERARGYRSCLGVVEGGYACHLQGENPLAEK